MATRAARKLHPTVTDAVAECEDRAAAELARTYARQIDGDGDLSKLGPALLACLEALGLTPRARATAMKGGGHVPGSQLDALRARRARRHGATPVDSPAP